MSNEENKESVIASYELTAAHKEDDDISESEVNDMINESEEGTVSLSNIPEKHAVFFISYTRIFSGL